MTSEFGVFIVITSTPDASMESRYSPASFKLTALIVCTKGRYAKSAIITDETTMHKTTNLLSSTFLTSCRPYEAMRESMGSTIII